MERELYTWLKPLGLAHYADVLQGRSITLKMLAQLSEGELTALGFTVDDRRRLALALENAKHAEAPAEELFSGQASAPSGPMTAERRWMTVLIFDLVDSTALSDRLDPEVLREVLAQYQTAVIRAVHRHRGYVGRYEGDGIISYFGWPIADEDQAERAVQAGITALAAVRSLSPAKDVILHARAGVSTGLVVMDEVRGSGGRSSASPVGRSPNLAARLQNASAPDQILIDDATRHEVGRRFQLQPLPPLSLKGLANPVIAWRVVASEPRETRFEAREAPRTALIGRTAELARLVELWREACGGAGRAVLMSGEAGIGKSRLVEELGHAAVDAPYLRLGFQCSALHVDTPLYPVIQRIERNLGFEETDTEATRAEKLEANFGPIFPDDPRALTLFADLLSLPTQSRPRLPSEPPKARRDRLLAALCTLLVRLSESQPVLVIVEDAHWIDPSLLELLQRIIEAIDDCKILLVMTQREAFEDQWRSTPHVSTMTLGRLGRNDSIALVKALAHADISATLVRRIAARADGVPLFIEEMTRAIVDQQMKPGGAAALESGDAVPKTLQAFLTSRLDNLGPTKVLAQTAAVVGRRFPLKLLAAIAGREGADLAAETEQLIRSGLFVARKGSSGPVLDFRHALMHEAAYESLLHADRRRLHGTALRSLEKLYPARLEALAEVLAVHAERAEDWPRAARYLGGAFMKAAGRSARREAANLYRRAVMALGHLPFEAAAANAIDLHLHAFGVFQALGETDTVVKIAAEAEELAQRLGDQRRLAAATSQSAFALWMVGDHVTALPRAEASLQIASDLEDFPLTIAAQYNLASIRYLLGDLSGGIALHRKTIDMLPGELAAKRFGWQAAPALMTRSFVGCYLLDSGDFKGARRLFEECRDMFAVVDRSFSRVLIPGGFGLYHLRSGDFDEAVPLLREAFDRSEPAEVFTMTALFAAWLGEALTGAEHAADAVAVLTDAVDRKTHRSCPNAEKHLRLALAEAQHAYGDRDAAFAELRQALHLTTTCNEVLYYAQARKLEGDFLLARADTAGARSAYREAIEIAEPRGGRLLAAHCKVGLGNCARRNGEDQESARWLEGARHDFDAMGTPSWKRRLCDRRDGA